MLFFIEENYSQVKVNINYWVKNCDNKPDAPPPPSPFETPEPTETQTETKLPLKHHHKNLDVLG